MERPKDLDLAATGECDELHNGDAVRFARYAKSLEAGISRCRFFFTPPPTLYRVLRSSEETEIKIIARWLARISKTFGDIPAIAPHRDDDDYIGDQLDRSVNADDEVSA